MEYLDFNVHEHGFVGHYVSAEICDKQKVVIVIMGGEKNILPGTKIAERFVDYGLSAISISLFGADGLPDSPNQIPIEMFGKAIDVLKEMGYTKISTYGMSMGSIFAILIGVYYPNIENIILVSCTHVPFEGTNTKRTQMTGQSVATWQGHDIPFVKADFTKYKYSRYYNHDKVMGMWKSFYEAYQDKERERLAFLPINQTGARILMIVGDMDEAWPARYSADRIEDFLEQSHYPKEFKVIHYKRAGHLLGMMPNRNREKRLYRMMPFVGLMYKTFGAHKKEGLEALEHAEKEIIEWLTY